MSSESETPTSPDLRRPRTAEVRARLRTTREDPGATVLVVLGVLLTVVVGAQLAVGNPTTARDAAPPAMLVALGLSAFWRERSPRLSWCAYGAALAAAFLGLSSAAPAWRWVFLGLLAAAWATRALLVRRRRSDTARGR